ncbi:MAG: M48 family metallopeptidase [Bacteroidota bacterium]
MTFSKVAFFTFLFFVLSYELFAQQNFDDFKNIKAEGEIPNDFIENAFDKISDDLEKGNLKLKGEAEKVFLEGVHYAINDLLHSGMVVYGDEVSNYVSSIADKLLVKDQDLRQKLRFYTIKSNQTNAFSTYQGIIFVTTGLISQLTNEAQLAYVLSHEIAHYTEEHVVQTFDLNAKNKKNAEKVQQLSKFSKENEFEADKLGVKLYYEAGYSKDELISTFDVLLYSYLPFEEIEFPKNYLNTDLLTIPEGFYPSKKYPIKALEDTDDSKSSHPNIKKRKDAVEKEILNYKDWGNKVFDLGEPKFKNIRNSCRFESIRTDIVDAEFDDALYSIFILEKEFPNSIYLQRMKAKAWLGYAQYKSTASFNAKLPNTKELEGEIASLQFLMKEMNKNQVITVSQRMVHDIYLKNPSDKVIEAIWERMVKTFAKSKKMELEKFSTKTYSAAYQDFLKSKSDTIQSNQTENKENLSKYDKIKKQNSSSSEVVLFDTSAFYLYALSDVISNKLFKDKYDFFKEEIHQEELDEDAYNKLSPKERRNFDKKEKEKRSTGLNSFIYLEPMVYSYSKNGIDRIKSEKLQIEYTKAVQEVSKEFNFKTTVIGSSNLKFEGTEMFNQRSTLTSYLSELVENEDIEVFPTDFNLLQEIRTKNETDKVMLSILEHQKSNKIKPAAVFGSLLIYPILLWYIPSKILKTNEIQYTTIILNLENGKIENRLYVESYENINKYTINARVYNLFHSIK